VSELATARGRQWADAWAATPDEELAARIRNGETALYEVLMRRYNQRLYRIARAIVRDDAEAEDVVQQAYVNAYLHLDQFAEKAKLSTWMTKIAVYEALARVRKRERAAATPFDESAEDTMKASVASPLIDPERQALTAELRLLLERAIDALPERYRSVFVLREIDGLSTAEAADCLDVTEENVKTRLHRAKAMLRDTLYARAGVAGPSVFELHLSRCDRIVDAVIERLSRVSSHTT
jgi:RNA polymerase sigma-70 factor (ECF subfamily)